jgi:hypothetical protein
MSGIVLTGPARAEAVAVLGNMTAAALGDPHVFSPTPEVEECVFLAVVATSRYGLGHVLAA